MGILMLSGLRDEVVPREQMKELWEIVEKRAEGKEGMKMAKTKFLEFEHGTHSEYYWLPCYWRLC
jgi:abhydrolase domain-containing protein 13